METAILYLPLPKRVPPGTVRVIQGKRPIRVITDPLFGDLTIYDQDTLGRRFWWIKEPARLDRLIAGWKTGLKAKRALDYAGISDEHWESIIREVPGIKRVKELCLAQPSFGAMNTVQQGLQTDPRLAYTFLKDRGDLHTEVEKVGDEKPLQQTVITQVNVHTNNEKRIEARSREILAERISKRSGASVDSIDQAMAGSLQG